MKEIKKFTIEVLDSYKLFYMLKNLNIESGNIEILYKTTLGNEEYENCSLFEMKNGYLLVAFDDESSHHSKHNLVATNGIISEIVNLSNFERIYKYYKVGVDSEDHGGFTFMNSAPVPSFDGQWRCDANLYGVEFFTDPTGGSLIEIPDEADELLVYEPIFSINGIGHIIYTERKNKTNKFNLMNNSVTPFAAYSIGESFKLILEWAKVSESPFDNSEDISIKAANFVNQIGLTESLVSNQPDMQIFEYLKGNLNARIRPSGVQDISDECDLFIKKNMSHISLSHLVSLYPDSWDLQEIIDKEILEIDTDVKKIFGRFCSEDFDVSIDNKDALVEHIKERINNPQLHHFANLRLGALSVKKKILDNLSS
jgi:hypothetical protein